MPKVLRWFTWMCFAFVLFLPLSLIPAGGHYINGTEVSFAEFWHRGGGPIFFVAGILFPVTGYGFVRAQNWSRFVFTALHFGIALTTVFYGSISFEQRLRSLGLVLLLTTCFGDRTFAIILPGWTTPAPNHAMERTANRRAFTFRVARTPPLRATHPTGGRRSSCSR